MKNAGVDFVTTCMDINEVIVLQKEMQKQGLDAVQHLPNGYDAGLVAANAELLEGAIVIPGFVAFEQEPQIPEQRSTSSGWTRSARNRSRSRRSGGSSRTSSSPD